MAESSSGLVFGPIISKDEGGKTISLDLKIQDCCQTFIGLRPWSTAKVVVKSESTNIKTSFKAFTIESTLNWSPKTS